MNIEDDIYKKILVKESGLFSRPISEAITDGIKYNSLNSVEGLGCTIEFESGSNGKILVINAQGQGGSASEPCTNFVVSSKADNNSENYNLEITDGIIYAVHKDDNYDYIPKLPSNTSIPNGNSIVVLKLTFAGADDSSNNPANIVFEGTVKKAEWQIITGDARAIPRSQCPINYEPEITYPDENIDSKPAVNARDGFFYIPIAYIENNTDEAPKIEQVWCGSQQINWCSSKTLYRNSCNFKLAPFGFLSGNGIELLEEYETQGGTAKEKHVLLAGGKPYLLEFTKDDDDKIVDVELV